MLLSLPMHRMSHERHAHMARSIGLDLLTSNLQFVSAALSVAGQLFEAAILRYFSVLCFISLFVGGGDLTQWRKFLKR